MKKVEELKKEAKESAKKQRVIEDVLRLSFTFFIFNLIGCAYLFRLYWMFPKKMHCMSTSHTNPHGS